MAEDNTQVLEPAENPAAAAAPVEPSTTEESAPSEPEAKEAPKSDPPKRSGAEKRIDVLTARNNEAQRELAELKRQLAERETPASEVKAPSYEDFDSDEAYLSALADYRVDQRLAKQAEETKARQQKSEANARQDQLTADFEGMVARGIDKHDDFESVFVGAASLPVTQSMLEALVSTDNGEDVAHHLGKNPGEADRISKLGVVQQAIEIGRLGERLANVKPAVSAAPEPVKPVDDTSAGADDPLSDKSDIKSWMKARQAQVYAA